MTELAGKIENLLFASGDSMPISGIAEIIGVDAADVEKAVSDEMTRRSADSGLIIKRFGDRVQLCTRAEYGELIANAFGRGDEEELTRATIETLAIIAYKQPVTRAEIEEIRGVNTSYMLSSLLEKKLIEEVGRRETVGHPVLYGTSESFLRHFGISSVEELPPLPPENEEEDEANDFEY